MKSDRTVNRFCARAGAVCAAGAGLLALGGLAGWWFDQWHPVAFGPDYVPMAPSTALLMLALSVAAGLRATAPASRPGRLLESGCVLLVLGGAVLFGAQFLFHFTSPVEQWLSHTTATVGEIPVGRMSPLTAGCFVVLAAALACGRSSAPRWQNLRFFGGWLALGVLLASGSIAAGYFAGAPLFYGGTTIPMALLTALCFALASSSTLLSAGGDTWPSRMFLPHPAFEGRGHSHRQAWLLLSLLLLLAAVIGGVGLRYLRHRQAQARGAAYETLEAIAELKVQQIASWQRERLTDANLLRATPYAARRALDALAQPESGRTRSMFTGFLEPLLGSGFYERLLLLDASGNVRFTHPKGSTPLLAETARQAAHEALRTRQVTVVDLHRNAEGEHIHLGVVVPLIVRREGTNDSVPAAGLPPSPGDRAAGLLILQVDASQFLFPLIQSWPTPSRTAETLLVRREGEEILFLNELRHQAGTAMRLRLPLNEPELPAARALRGEKGVFEGKDYRGVPVVATSRAVSGTPWVMVAKVDAEELYAPLRRETIMVGAVAAALLLAAGLTVSTLGRRRNEQLLRTQLQTEHERRALAERFEHLMRHASDAILLADEHDRIIEVNNRGLAIYGYTPAEFQQLPLRQLRAPECQEGFSRQAAEMAAAGEAAFETRHRRKDGTTFPVEISSRLVEIGGQRCKLGIIRDITQRKQHEAEIERLNRLYAALSEINQVLVRARSREELFAEVCRIVVRIGGFRLAWVGWLDRATQAVTPVASAGDGGDFLLQVQAFADGRPEGQDPVGTCLREGRPVLRNDLAGTSDPMPGHGEALRRGFRALAAFPIRWRETVEGALVVYAAEAGVFAGKEAALLEEAAGDISFALDKLDKEEQRARAEVALQGSETALRQAMAGLEGSRRALLSVVEDQKQAEAQVRRLNDELEQRVQRRTAQLVAANQELEAFSYSVSHDLRAPLRHISGYVDLLRRESGPALSAPAHRFLQTIEESAVGMGRLIDDLLAFSRIGRSELRRLRLNMGDLVSAAVSQAELDAAGAQIVWQVATLPEVEADPDLLRLVWFNLLSNAVKYSRGRTPAVIEIGCQAAEREDIFFVRDNGVGFEMAYVDKLFGVFQRLHSAAEFAGTGIGLANVRRIVARHGGRTWAEGAVDRGATFFFSLPKRNPTNHESPPKHSAG
jgi:PAS domain S-box-containing protein